MTRSTSRTLLALAATVACLRFAAAVYKAPPSAGGDFQASLPGAYVKTLNPALWDDPMLAGSYGYHRDIYVYGPTQYLVLYPIGLLPSYSQISTVLGWLYAALIASTLFLIAALLEKGDRFSLALLTVATMGLLFPPLYQAYIQREFEVVVLFSIVAATWLLAERRDGWAGAVLGSMIWFKLWPIAFLPLFLVTRRFRAVAGMIGASCIVLGAAEVLFGLNRFILNPTASVTIPGRDFTLTSLIPHWERVWYSFPGGDVAVGGGFCRGWYEAEQTAVGFPWAACRLNFSHGWVTAPVLFYGVVAVITIIGLAGIGLLARRGLHSEDDRRWYSVVEMSLGVIAASMILSAHYYYFAYLVLPLGALVYRFGVTNQWIKLGCVVAAYLLLSAFLLPMSVMTRVLHVDFWKYYTSHVLYFYGELMLIGLLLWEYLALGLKQPLVSHPAVPLAGEWAR